MNFEDFLSKNIKFKDFLPELIPLWEQLRSSIAFSQLINSRQRTIILMLDLMASLDLREFEKYLGDKIDIININHSGVYNISGDIDNIDLNKLPSQANLMIYRKGNDLKVTYWR